ncbi:NADH:ubiquinone oxidoreductase subunit N [Bacillus methanolicus PB1]|uniref:NADH-quinone oxidoreductase subunit N n=1 Tax=Bacillus methanolicus PB1 TaxID=997296 RepID=I3E1G0_BACMT|nr:NADH-quinone oxidoreductase subunit NuoN [Bacillus methanolicus]EIJ80331.1 NADH:ubiquinone oxidoreductase subunit N [Bacillus methanolicus PB1]
MDMKTFLSLEWEIMAPEFIILGIIILISLLDIFMSKRADRKVLGWIGIAGVIGAAVSLALLIDHSAASILYDTFRLDSFSKAFKLLLLIGAVLVLFLAVSYEPKEGIEYKGEFYYLFLAALLGAMMMASSGDLISLFTGLELLSISSYILAGMRKKHLLSNESAMKYVINGGISTAVTLFGMSYVYGLAGTTNLKAISTYLTRNLDEQHIYLLGLAFFMIFIGLSFKLASAPFHMWAPDVYEGAPTPVTAFLGVASKTAGFVLLVRVLLVIFLSVPSDSWPGSDPLLIKVQDYMAFLAGATMIIGNVIALRQRNVKRLFAYSSIAHAGYLLVAVATVSTLFETMWFYLLAYLFMNLGAFAVIQLLTEKADSEDISHFSGLYRRSPVLAVAMAIFILSLAGIPGTAGFIGKLNIFIGALITTPAHYVLASVMIAATIVSYYYYFGIMSQMFFRPQENGEKVMIQAGIGVVIGICAVGTILFGIMPNLALDFLHTNFDFTDLFQ